MIEKQLDELFSEMTLNTNSRVRKKYLVVYLRKKGYQREEITEIIVMLVEETVIVNEDGAAEVRRRPSPKLKSTRIIGDIMSPAVPEADWDVLK